MPAFAGIALPEAGVPSPVEYEYFKVWLLGPGKLSYPFSKGWVLANVTSCSTGSQDLSCVLPVATDSAT